MHGDRRPFLTALITLDPEEIVPWAQKQGIEDTDMASLAQNEQVRALVQEAVDEVNEKVARVEEVKKFTILPHDLTQETGELTPTLKVKRNVVNEKFADELEGMYRSRPWPPGQGPLSWSVHVAAAVNDDRSKRRAARAQAVRTTNA